MLEVGLYQRENVTQIKRESGELHVLDIIQAAPKVGRVPGLAKTQSFPFPSTLAFRSASPRIP